MDTDLWGICLGYIFGFGIPDIVDYETKYEAAIYPKNFTRNWLINAGVKLIWVAMGNTLSQAVKNVSVM